jgi:rhodanese-related sulfurtransferase
MRLGVSFREPSLEDLNLPVPEIPDDLPSFESIRLSGDFPGDVADDLFDQQQFQLPTLRRYIGKIPFISPSTLAQIMTDPSVNPFSQTIIFDARSLQEYNGGHIRGSQNAENLQQLLTGLPRQACPGKVGIILHCEFTSRRAPTLAQAFREYDRQMHLRDESLLSYPDTYLLDGGYCAFYTQFPTLCQGSYLRQEDCVVRRVMSQSNIDCFGTDLPVGRLSAVSLSQNTCTSLPKCNNEEPIPE